MTHRALPALAHRPRAGAGFTLVELLVALFLSLLLAVGLLSLQGNLGQQRMRGSDIAERDSELRAAMDLITQDLSGSAYLFGNMTQPCDAIFSFNGNPSSMFFTRHQVDGLAASTGETLNFAGGLTLNYPSGSVPSDVLITTGSANASNFNDLAAPQIKGDPASTQNTLSNGVLQVLPPTNASAALPALHDFALVEASIPNPTGSGSQNACFRVQVTSVAGNLYGTAGSSYMPAGSFASFQPSLTAAGFGTLGNGELRNDPRLVDIGQAGGSSQVTTAYFIDNSGTFPVLMRTQWSLDDDSQISSQAIAAGVVSLQVRFKVGSGWNYFTAAQVTSNNTWSQVCAVRVAVIARTLSNDPKPGWVWAPTALTPGTATAVAPGASYGFTNYPISNVNRHYMMQTTEVPVRNTLWRSGGPTC